MVTSAVGVSLLSCWRHWRPSGFEAVASRSLVCVASTRLLSSVSIEAKATSRCAWSSSTPMLRGGTTGIFDLARRGHRVLQLIDPSCTLRIAPESYEDRPATQERVHRHGVVGLHCFLQRIVELRLEAHRRPQGQGANGHPERLLP